MIGPASAVLGPITAARAMVTDPTRWSRQRLLMVIPLLQLKSDELTAAAEYRVAFGTMPGSSRTGFAKLGRRCSPRTSRAPLPSIRPMFHAESDYPGVERLIKGYPPYRPRGQTDLVFSFFKPR